MINWMESEVETIVQLTLTFELVNVDFWCVVCKDAFSASRFMLMFITEILACYVDLVSRIHLWSQVRVEGEQKVAELQAVVEELNGKLGTFTQVPQNLRLSCPEIS